MNLSSSSAHSTRIACARLQTTTVITNHVLPWRKLRIATLLQVMSVTRLSTGWHTNFGSLEAVTHSVVLEKLPSASAIKCFK